jgi:hypothetical protein
MHRDIQLICWLSAVGLGVALQAITSGEPGVPEASEDGETELGADSAPPPSLDGSGEGAEAANPYQAITARNAFGLKDPPPPPPPPLKEVAPPVNTSALKLTGITTLLGKRAMFAFNDGKTNNVSGLLSEGDGGHFLTNFEVLEIDASAKAVKVLFGGQELRLDFVNNGLRPPTNMVAPGVLPAGGFPRPGGPPGLPVAGQPVAPNFGGNPTTPSIQAGATAFNAGGLRTVPTRPNRLGTAAAAAQSAGAASPTIQPISPEQQVLILQEQHRLAREQNIELPPAPPAPGLENLGGGPPVPPGMGGPPGLPGQ